MNRRGFLKAFAGTSVAAVAAPLVALAGKEYASGGIVGHIQAGNPLDLSHAEHIVPAYRGTAYVGVSNDDLTPGWRKVPSYSFKVKS